MVKKYVIISPHWDDACIGCASLIAVKIVDAIIFTNEELTAKKWEELSKFAKEYDVRVIPYEVCRQYLLKEGKDKIFMLPSMNSTHSWHRTIAGDFLHMLKINKIQCSVGYYSIDMTDFFVTPMSDIFKKMKKKMLNKYFASGNRLWKYNEQYYLFEGMVVKL